MQILLLLSLISNQIYKIFIVKINAVSADTAPRLITTAQRENLLLTGRYVQTWVRTYTCIHMQSYNVPLVILRSLILFFIGVLTLLTTFQNMILCWKKWVFPSSLFYIERKMWTRRFYWPYQRQNDYMCGMLKRSARRTWCQCSRFYTIMLVSAGKNVGKKISNDSIILYNRFYIW